MLLTTVLLGAGLAAAFASGVIIIVSVAFLTLCDVIDKLKEYRKIREQGRFNRIGFQLTEKIKSGNYRVVTGIWDEKEETVKAGTCYDAKEVDSNIKNSEELVLYP